MKNLLLLLITSSLIFSCTKDEILPTPPVPPAPSLPEWTNIPNIKFENSLISQGIDDVVDGRVLTSKISSLTFFRMEHTHVEDITGIENFVNLEVLLLWQNDFTSIDLTKLKKLKILGLGECPLDTVDLSQNTELIELDFQANSQRANDPTYPYGKTLGFTSLDLTHNVKIERIYIWTNRITELDVSMLPNLTDLWIGGSEFWSGGTGGGNPIETLDLSNNPKLNVLVADGCNLKSLNIKNTANNGVPRTCITKNNPELFEIKVNNVNAVQAWRNSYTPAGSLVSEIWWFKDTFTNYIE